MMQEATLKDIKKSLDDISWTLKGLEDRTGALVAEVKRAVAPERIAEIEEMVEDLSAYTIGVIPPAERKKTREKHLWRERWRRGEAERDVSVFEKRTLVVYHGTAPGIKSERSRVFEIPPAYV